MSDNNRAHPVAIIFMLLSVVYVLKGSGVTAGVFLVAALLVKHMVDELGGIPDTKKEAPDA